jgi:transglutaminase-like putative cysteine protease
VLKHLDFKITTKFSTATEVLERGHGDCKDHAVLFVTLARAAGIPARTVHGFAYGGDCEPRSFFRHVWAEVHDGRQWVSVDPTLDQVFVAATHIARTCDELGPIEVLRRDLTLESFGLEPKPTWWHRFK